MDATTNGSDSAGNGSGSVSYQTVSIELTLAQVDQVVRGAAGAGAMSVLLSGLEDVRGKLDTKIEQLEDPRLSQSLLAGLMMLSMLPADGSYLKNADIARALDMNASTAHRYVSTLLAVGLVERDPATRRYRLAHVPAVTDVARAA
jgi:hypothetical protein